MPIEILMPALSPTMEEGSLAKWLIKEGDTVSAGDVIAEIETDKATMELEAVDEGKVARLLVPEGTTQIKVNNAIALLLEEGESPGNLTDAAVSASKSPDPALVPAPPAADPAGPAPAGPNGGRIIASPLARRMADQNGLDLSLVTGTGPRGRIVKRDIEAALQSDTARAPAPDRPAPPVAPAPQPATGTNTVLKTYADRPHAEIALDGMRRTIAARLTEAKQTIPHFYLRRGICIDAMLDLRKQINAQMAPRGIKLSVNDFVIKACAQALQHHPAANAVWAGDRILQLTPSDVAVAVSVEGGLFTPVLRDAETKPLSALSTEMKDLAARARDRKLTPQDYQGGSFAISNLGMFGIENFDAVINPPQSAILAVGAGLRKPMVGADETLTIATVMSVTLSVDHRVIDGALGAELLAAIVDGLENPLTLLV